MGYDTRFKGVLKFSNKLDIDQLKVLNEILGERIPGASYCQFQVTKDMTGIEWDGGEKFYDAEKAAQYVIDYMRSDGFSDFGLTGELLAQGESIEDRWRLRCTGDKCERVEDRPAGEKVKCPHCLLSFYPESKP